MAGFENTIVFSQGHKLSTSSSDDISRMQDQSTDISTINYIGNPEGVINANPSSICHDPSSGNIYLKQTGTGNTGWVLFTAAGGGFNGFLAYLSGNVTNVTGDGTDYIVEFDSTSYNVGSNFDTSTFTYTAPDTGVYLFGGVLYGFGYGAGHTQQTSSIITTSITFNSYTVNPFTMAGNGTLILPFSQQLHLTAGDTVTLSVNVNNSTKTIGFGGLLGLSSFWGQFLG